jgi:nitrogenase molybdenum-iron protein alpha chain
MEDVLKVQNEIRPRCEGKQRCSSWGDLVPITTRSFFLKSGWRQFSAGYEFAHRDDYEGRKVIPGIVIDADTRNIEELTETPDEKRFNPRKSSDDMVKLDSSGFTFSDYNGMMTEMKDNRWL